MANKKINQLVLKTTIQPTDLFPLGDATTGQLYKKTIADLQAAIGGAVISVNGLVGTVVLDTDDIQELASPTNKYFTDARARAAISLTTTGSSGASTYSSSTGVLNVPTYTLAGLGGITASFLSGGTGITYNSGTGVISYSGTVYTDSSIRALFSAGTGLSYNSSTGAFTNTAPDQTVAIAGGTGISVTGTYPSFTVAFTGTIYTDSSIRGLFSGTAPITFNASTGAIGITQATTSTNGYLSSTDWNTFNGKQSALTLGNVTESVSNVLMFPDGGTNKTIGNLSIQVIQAGSTSSGYLSTTDWNTFNNKQNAITLTTTGSSGAATFSGGTLNIPQYQAVLTNPVTGTGTSGYVAKWTSSSAIGNGNLYDSGSNVGLGTTTPAGASGTTFEINGVAGQARLSIKNNATGSTSTSGLQIGVDTGGAAFIENRGANSLQLNTNGSARLFITSAGNVGIGTTSPSQLLEVNNGTQSIIKNVSGTRTLQLESYAADWNYLASTGNNLGINVGGANALVINVNSAERMRILSNGNIGIGGASSEGAASDDRVLTIHNSNSSGSMRSMIRFTNFNTGSAWPNGAFFTIDSSQNFYISNLEDASTIFQTNGSERGRITGGGNWLLGTQTDNGERLYVSGSIRATGSITANSDVRLKKNIERIENALQKVSEISGYTYNTIYDEDRHAGVIAQEIDKVLPEIVNKGNDGLMGVEYGNISALLIEAIKEQKVLIESLQAKVEALSK
jgi:hypothetical protein